MSQPNSISDHYSSGDLLARLEGALREDGIDPTRPSFEALAPYDQFHGRGMEATEELANLVSVSSNDHILDVGSGIGGPARFMAHRFGCRVSGVDLTREFCDVARHLIALLGLDEKVTVEQGDALAMSFGDATFDGAYSMNVSMNIADKRGLYGEIHRVLKPGAWLVLSEVARGGGGDPDYPTPWARTAASSFLATPEETRAGLEASGFAIDTIRETTEAALAYGARSRALVERGEKPLHRAVALIHGDLAAEAMANTARALKEGCVIPIEILARKRTA
jgi:ubiquinone/menaquinone biosynthesis C-methylase UbiE